MSESTVPTVAALVKSAEEKGMVRVTFPNPDPGVPVYARLTTLLNQVFHDDEWVAVPFYRTPGAIHPDFNLLSYFDFPGPNGPGAFGVPLTVSGFYMVEAGSPLGTFPQVSISTGDAVPFWFVPWSTFEQAMQDNVVTMAELEAMNPLRGTATQFTETLRPRAGEHLVVINASGTLSDGRTFDFHVTHIEDTTRSIRISIK